MAMTKFVLHLEKQSLYKLDPAKSLEQLRYITQRALGGNRGNVWTHGAIAPPSRKDRFPDDGYIYTSKITFERSSGRTVSDDIRQKQWETICDMADGAGRSKNWIVVRNGIVDELNKHSKLVREVVSEANKSGVFGNKLSNVRYDEPKKEQTGKSYANVELSRLDSIEGNEHFAHIYARDAQINIVHSAIRAFIDSDYENRFHAVLFGPPACGKTEVLRSFARALGPEAVLNFDATSTTKAGAEKIILETENIPPILMVEEIEKTDENSLRWLLGLLDHRAEIRKITFRQVSQRNVKLLCLATVNDMDLFKRVMDGALASRFAHKVYCPRPDREVLTRILLREIKSHNGDEKWIEPALDFVLDFEQSTDPRRVIAVCMSGREKLLSGEYQEFLKKAMEPK